MKDHLVTEGAERTDQIVTQRTVGCVWVCVVRVCVCVCAELLRPLTSLDGLSLQLHLQ